MKKALFLLVCMASALLKASGADVSAPGTTPKAILVVGAPGEPAFTSNFLQQVELWTNICSRGRVPCVSVGLGAESQATDHDRLKKILAAEPQKENGALWIVLIGHGTFDGKDARFNLRGPDVTAAELSKWLNPFRRPLVVVNTASASAPFLNALSRTNRVIITATRSGNEQNLTRFGLCFAQAMSGEQADIDKDGQTSALEAFLTASAGVAEFYKTEGRLMTEHALIDDNGDGLGTPADWFRGVRPVKKPEGTASVDGLLARQLSLVLSPGELSLPPELRARRDALELAIARLREAKAQVASEDDYYRDLEKLLTQLVQVYGTNL